MGRIQVEGNLDFVRENEPSSLAEVGVHACLWIQHAVVSKTQRIGVFSSTCKTLIFAVFKTFFPFDLDQGFRLTLIHGAFARWSMKRSSTCSRN